MKRKVHLSVICPLAIRSVDVFADQHVIVNEVARQSLDYFNNCSVKSKSYLQLYDGKMRDLDQDITVKDAGLKSGSVLVLNIGKKNGTR